MAESDNEGPSNEEEQKLFYIEYSKTNRSKCKRCKNMIDSGAIRIAKVAPNPFGTGTMKVWHHVSCIFEAFKRQRATTPKILKVDDMCGYETIKKEDIETLLKLLPDDAREHWESIKDQIAEVIPEPKKQIAKKRKLNVDDSAVSTAPLVISKNQDIAHKDNSLRQFRKICHSLTNESSSLQKTSILKEFFQKGSDGTSFHGDLLLWVKLLLPGVVKTIYNMQSKQLIKIFSKIFETDLDEMLTHLEGGDVAFTISEFFQKSNSVQPATKCYLSIHEVNIFLEKLSHLTKEDEQQNHLTSILKNCTANDLQVIIRFIKHDLRINAGPKPILDALHPDAYEAFKTCKDIDRVINQISLKQTNEKSLKIGVKLLTPVQPMLAAVCSSLEAVLKKHPIGLYTEIKYDGERVQLHKQGFSFKYFSRSLKPVLSHKVEHFKDYITKAFPSGDDLILDCEVLMIDMKTGDPLPFGTLGKHKKNEFEDANPCLYIFDCLYFNGDSLLDRTFKERRNVLLQNMTPIPNHIEFSETKLVKDLGDLETMLRNVLDRQLEGLVLKDPEVRTIIHTFLVEFNSLPTQQKIFV